MIKKVGNYLTQGAPLFLAILLGSILLSIGVYFSMNYVIGFDILLENDYSKKLDSLCKIVGISISLIGFVSIIITINQSRKSIQRDVQQNSVELFKELRNQEFLSARRRAWKVKEKWYNEEGYRYNLIIYNFQKISEQTNPELDQEIKDVYQLLEFYLLVSQYEGNPAVLKSLRYFYYGWWRPFLYDFAYQIENNSKVNEQIKNEQSSYFEDISYTNTLRRLDQLCGLSKFPENTIFHFDGG